MDEIEYLEQKQKYEAEMDSSLLGLFTNPMENPLATGVASLILTTFGYQAYITGAEMGAGAGLLVLVTMGIAWQIGKGVIEVENSMLASELAKRDTIE